MFLEEQICIAFIGSRDIYGITLDSKSAFYMFCMRNMTFKD